MSAANFTFSRAGAAYKDLSAGGISQVAAGVPRVGGEGGGVLIEGASTNLQLYANDLSHAAGYTYLSYASATGIDGVAGNCALVETADTGYHTATLTSSTVVVSSTYVFSCYLKAGLRSLVLLSWTGSNDIYFNFATGKVGTVGAAALASGMLPAGNGYYHCWVKFTAASTSFSPAFYFCNGAEGTYSYAGDTSANAAYLSCAQVELGSFPTSYIPTTTASASRVADNLTISAANVGLPATALNNVTVEFDAKCLWSGNTAGPTYPYFISLGYNAATVNALNIFPEAATGNFYADIWNIGGTRHRMRVNSVAADYSLWHRYRVYFDFTNLANSTLYIDGVSQTVTGTNLTGAATFIPVYTNSTIYLGGYNDGTTIQLFGKIKNLSISAG